MDGWMTCDFTSFSTVFQSYQYDGRLILKGCEQWNSVFGWEDIASSGDQTQSARSIGQRLTHWATRAPYYIRLLNFGTPELINFPFGTNGKLIMLGVPVLRYISVCVFLWWNNIEARYLAHNLAYLILCLYVILHIHVLIILDNNLLNIQTPLSYYRINHNECPCSNKCPLPSFQK